MGFKELSIKTCYESGTGNIIEDFYIPVLDCSIQYDRIAGFFSSSSLVIASRGLYGFIKNGGRMRLITSPRLGPEDAEMIEKCTSQSITLPPELLKLDLEELNDDFFSNHVKALGWMISKGLLDIKLAIVYNNMGRPCFEEEIEESGLFHQKVGILRDKDGNELSFSGSINESASAWIYNDEEFKVFKAWTGAREYYESDKIKFEEYWNNKREKTKVFNLPEAIKLKLISYSKNFNIESLSLKEYKKKYSSSYISKDVDISLFHYQAEALKKWRDNGYRLLFEMATGTGKTRTAIAGVNQIMKVSSRFVAIVSTPQNTLSKQWKSEVEKLNLSFDAAEIIDGSITNWKKKLSKTLLANSVGMANHCIIFTTHNTASSEEFISIINRDLAPETKTLFVGDEVHWLGAAHFRKALLSSYEYRIGLSATPSRWFDENGTQFLMDYFGNDHFVFSIREALTEINPLTGKHFLVNYYYHISTVSLNNEETIEYRRITNQIIRLQKMIANDDEALEKYQRALEKRANVTKNAVAKYDVLEEILDSLMRQNMLQDIIIFVSPEQKETVMEILYNRNVVFHNLTEAEGTRKEKKYGGLSEREYIICQFKQKTYKTLVAIKCLDCKKRSISTHPKRGYPFTFLTRSS